MILGRISALVLIGAALLPVAAIAGNPALPGYYADPEIRAFDGQYWIYPTYSDHDGAPDLTKAFTPAQDQARKASSIRPSYLYQTFFNAFSSPDLVHWKKHSHVLDVATIPWAYKAIWAPSVIEQGGRYYMFFSANDIQNDDETGGIGLAVSDSPGGPFRDAIGKPLIDKFHNGAQPIDPFVYRDEDGQIYLFYGGWKHCNVVRLSADMRTVIPFEDGTTYKEITPPGYVEGSFLIKRKGVYYFMWSEGGWTGPTIASPMRPARPPPGHSHRADGYWRRISGSRAARGIIPCSTFLERTTGSSPIIAAHWATMSVSIGRSRSSA